MHPTPQFTILTAPVEGTPIRKTQDALTEGAFRDWGSN